MIYTVELENRARRDLLSLQKDVQGRVVDALESLQKEPRPPGAKRLVAKAGYRIRIGAYRVLYTVEERPPRVLVYRIGHRREVYRGL